VEGTKGSVKRGFHYIGGGNTVQLFDSCLMTQHKDPFCLTYLKSTRIDTSTPSSALTTWKLIKYSDKFISSLMKNIVKFYFFLFQFRRCE